MPWHFIALDEISGLGKSTQAQKLQRFLMQKSYRVKAITLLQNEITTYTLTKIYLYFQKSMQRLLIIFINKIFIYSVINIILIE